MKDIKNVLTKRYIISIQIFIKFHVQTFLRILMFKIYYFAVKIHFDYFNINKMKEIENVLTF